MSFSEATVKLTIIPSDGVVGVDGEFRSVSMAGIDPNIHAVHFDDALNEGEIEFKQRGRSPQSITAFPQAGLFMGRWTAAAPPPPTPEVRKAGADELIRALLKKGVITQAELDSEL